MKPKTTFRFSLRALLVVAMIVALVAYWVRPERLDRSCFPIGVGYKWVYNSAGGDVVFEVVARQNVGVADCYVVDRTIGQHRVKFYIEVNQYGVLVHQVGQDRYVPAYQQFRFATLEGAQWEWRGTIDGQPAEYVCLNRGRVRHSTKFGEWDAWFVDQRAESNTDFYLARGVGVVYIRSKSRDKHDPAASTGEPTHFVWELKEFTKP